MFWNLEGVNLMCTVSRSCVQAAEMRESCREQSLETKIHFMPIEMRMVGARWWRACAFQSASSESKRSGLGPRKNLRLWSGRTLLLARGGRGGGHGLLGDIHLH